MEAINTQPSRPNSSIFLPDLLLVEDLVPVLRMTPSGVRAAMRSGRIPGRRVGRRWMVTRQDLLAFVRNADTPSVTAVTERATEVVMAALKNRMPKGPRPS